MFKSKKNRDSALLIFMALVMVVFLLYLFFPSASENDKNGNVPVKKVKSGRSHVEKQKLIKEDKSSFANLREIFRGYFNSVNTGDRIITNIPADKIDEELRRLFGEKYSEEIGRALKYRLRDLDRAIDVFKDTELSDRDKFDLYTALFLIRAFGEDIIGRSLNFTLGEIKELLNLKHYSFINNEATENYQTIPVIIYADILIKKVDIFQPGEDIAIFSKMVDKIGDITPMQHINSLKDIFSFSKELRKFSFSWVEKDALDPDDKGEYKNISIRRRKSFKLQYLLFPDPEKGGDNTWIRDLVNADNGSIELADLKIADETPGENFSAKSIIYSAGTSRFIIVMDSPSFVSERGYIAIMLNAKMKRVNSENVVINFAEKLYSKKEFRDKIGNFGKFLYKIRSVF